jgi:predicted ester cyclase
VANDHVWHGPGGKEARGLKALKELAAGYLRAFPDLRMSIEDQIAEGDRVVTRWTAQGTHKGSLEGIAPTGKAVKVTGIVVDRFAGGKWVEEWESFDELGMMQQIGAIPAASRA